MARYRRSAYSRRTTLPLISILRDLSIYFFISGVILAFPSFSTDTSPGLVFNYSFSIIEKHSLNNVVIVTTGCNESPDEYHPPRDRYTVVDLRCDPNTNLLDARETGQILRFFANSYDTFAHKKLIFCHAHDTSWHLGEMSIWHHIDHLVQTDYFWNNPFGNVMRCYIIEVFFRYAGNELHCQMDEDTWWMNMTDFAYYLFEGTSFMKIPWTNWNTPCCSTFFMDADLITQHPREEYVLLLERVQTMVRLGYCRMFDRQSCRKHASVIEESPKHWNFVVGGLLERAWGPMFTRLPNQEWNLTATW